MKHSIEVRTAAEANQSWPVSWVLLTPKLAEEFLARNTNNRNVKPDTIKKLTTDMVAGLYVPNGNSIAFDENGDMVDGQHRCLAVIKTGVPVLVLVVNNLPPEARMTTDGGARRTAGDILTMAGHVNARNVAAAVRMAEQLRSWMSGANSTVAMSNQAILGEIEGRYSECIEECMLLAVRVGSRKPASVPTAVVSGLSLVAIDSGVPFEEVNHFWSRYNDVNRGEAVITDPHDPIVRLRESLMMSAGTNRETKAVAALAIKAWNAHRAGVAVKQLKWRSRSSVSPEQFPVMAD